MKHKILAVAMLIGAVGQIACSPSASDCNADTACRQGVLAMNTQNGPTLTPLGPASAAGSQVPGGLQPFRAASVANAAIKAQSLKVAAAIAADDNNPESPNWKIPTPDVGKSTASRTTASTSSATYATSSVRSGSDTGEASR